VHGMELHGSEVACARFEVASRASKVDVESVESVENVESVDRWRG
jgi:hypothetical protein